MSRDAAPTERRYPSGVGHRKSDGNQPFAAAIPATPWTVISARRSLLDTPYQREHQERRASLFRQPQSLRDYLRELHEAVDAEVPDRLHRSGIEWETQEGGSHLGTPRWTADFRAFITGSPCAIFDDGTGTYWRYPLRSALFRMTVSGSGTTRSAAEYVFYLPFDGYSVRDAWGRQLGIMARPSANEVAEAWAAEALKRWWGFYVEQPYG